MERRAISIQGTVQGVGFRPFVFGLASSLELGGFVRNGTGGVRIEVEGDSPIIEQFVARLLKEPPPLARIERWSMASREPCGERGFRIEASDSESSANDIAVTPDAATCEQCLGELFDPKDRRYRYPFLNCTNCGPRLTIVRAVPYDRERTTMAGFPMCAACREEHENPADRRFHAQPVACPACGPQLRLLDEGGNPLSDRDQALAGFVRVIQIGGIGALKGIGGYHLACDARNSAAVAELRRRKHRDEKPFAIMVPDVASAAAICELDEASQALLVSIRRPIVLLKRQLEDSVANDVAPGNPYLGVMLPYTPLHHLLLHDLAGIPLVMTSGNCSDEPIAYEDADAVERLSGVADVFLTHDRPIHVRCDDSVTRVIGGSESPIRRSRGYAPHAIALPIECPVPTLAVGGQLKATFALAGGKRAILSHHMGDLDHFEAYRAFERDVGLYEQLFSIRPRLVAHDLHPDYASTRYAQQLSREMGLKMVAVQHHHAHMASCMAEHSLMGPVIGVSLDGTGYGTDGAIWGGEFLVGDYREFRRAAHFRYVGMPGGERAIKEPWRMAVAHLLDVGIDPAPVLPRVDTRQLRMIHQMVDRKLNSPPTSSVGRLFDAVASIARVRDRVSYEGQAAIQLEWLAGEPTECPAYPFNVLHDHTSPLVVDTRPMIRAIATEALKGTDAATMSRRLHRTMVVLITEVCRRIRDQCGIDRVVLSGGVFMNANLSIGAEEELRKSGFAVWRHQHVPPNDGGISLGQIAIAAAQ